MTPRALAVAVILSLCSSASAQDPEELADVGRPAPLFRLPAYDAPAAGASMVGLDRYVGWDAADKKVKLVVLSFMASYCAPCKKEMPYLQELNQRYQDFGLRVLMVSIDTEPAGMAKVGELIAANKVTFPVLKDRFNLVARRWLGSKSPLPSVFMIKPDGTVNVVHRGYDEKTSAVLAQEIEGALGIRRGPVSASVR